MGFTGSNEKELWARDLIADYIVKKLTLTEVSQQRELLDFVKEVSEWDKDYSSTSIKLKAKELLKANCG